MQGRVDRNFLQNHPFQYQCDWEQFVKLETSLNRILQQPQNFCLTHSDFTKVVEQVRELKGLLEVIKMERKSYASLQEANKSIQLKLQNHNSIVAAVEQSYADRLKAFTEEARIAREQLEKYKRTEKERNEATEKELNELREQIKSLEAEGAMAKRRISELESRNKQLTAELVDRDGQVLKLVNVRNHEQLPQPRTARLEEFLSSSTNRLIVQFLAPKDLAVVLRLSKTVRSCVLGSRSCVSAMLTSTVKTGLLRLRQYKNHVKYFETSCEKIPEEMIQSAFYKYMILKKKAGEFMLPVLNSCALLFEGKFVEVNIECDEDREEKCDNDLIKVDEEIKLLYQEEVENNKRMASEEVLAMYKKIHGTAQLYSADVESIGLFLGNLEKNYSRLFVGCKLLTNEVRSIQILLTYLLSLVSQRHSLEVSKNSEIEDMKAQLESEVRIKNFFSSKCLHAQQRALALENDKLNQEMKLKDATLKLTELTKEETRLRIQLQETDKRNQTLSRDNRSLRQNFEVVSEKYKEVIRELQLLQETIAQMKIS